MDYRGSILRVFRGATRTSYGVRFQKGGLGQGQSWCLSEGDLVISDKERSKNYSLWGVDVMHQ